MLLTSMSKHSQPNKLNKELEKSWDNSKKIYLSRNILTHLLTSMIFNQETIRYGTVVKLGLIPMEGGKRASVITSSFKVNECRRGKLQSKHHSGAR